MKFRALPAFILLSLLLMRAYAEPSGKALLDAGRVDDAVILLQQQVVRNPQDAAANNLLCRAYYMMEEWDRGISACERARNLDPQNSLYNLWLGRIYGEKADRAGFLSAAGLAKKVRTSFERAVDLDPKSWQARSDLVEFYRDAPSIVGGGKDKAKEQAEATMALNPGIAHWLLSTIAEKNKDSTGAEGELRAGISASNSGARAWFELGYFMFRGKRFDEMEQAFQHLESGPVDHPEAVMDAGSVLLRAGRNYPLAAKLLRRYLEEPIEEGPSFRAYDLLGQVLERQGDRAGAASAYRAALGLYRNYPRALEGLRRVSH
jgi:tetratricopeptide (TPR) repeat protein